MKKDTDLSLLFTIEMEPGALLVYDITKYETFANAERWLGELRAHAGQNISVILVGSKRDLESMRVVSQEEAMKFAEKHGMMFIETSALEDRNVDLAFEKLVTGIFFSWKGREFYMSRSL